MILNKNLICKILISILVIGGVSLLFYCVFLHPKIKLVKKNTTLNSQIKTDGINFSYSTSGCKGKGGNESGEIKNLDERVDVKVVGNNVNLTHHLNYVCCAQIRVNLEVLKKSDYTLLRVREKNEGEMCRCRCRYIINIRIGNLKKGRYLLQVFGVDFKDTQGRMRWEKEIEVGKREKTGLADPASLYCVKQGGKLVIRKGKKGQYGVCIFDDGSECEEWSLYYGKCKKSEKFCKDLCGDGVCDEIVCQAVSCPCPETPETCPTDCK